MNSGSVHDAVLPWLDDRETEREHDNRRDEDRALRGAGGGEASVGRPRWVRIPRAQCTPDMDSSQPPEGAKQSHARVLDEVLSVFWDVLRSRTT